MAKQSRAAFTLVEVLIVVVIMAVLAATIVPQFSASTDDAKDSQVEFNAHTLQSQIQLYRAQHGGNYPPIASGSIPNLLKKTNSDGTDTGNPDLGPYLLEIPTNTHTNSNTVAASTDGSPTGAAGWLYDESTGRVWADRASAPSGT